MVQGAPVTEGRKMPLATEEGKGSRLSNNIYRIPGASRLVSIRDAAYYFMGEVLSRIDGGRAKIKDVIDGVNKIFLEHNPDGWQTANPQKRAPSGGFTISALRHIGKAAPGRWATKPTFCVDDNDLVVVITVITNAAAPESDGSSGGGGHDDGDE